MPELPEVEATRRNLERWTVGVRVAAVEVVDPTVARAAGPAGSARAGSLAGLSGARVVRWERRGKVLAGVTDGPVVYAHLGMTGRWVALSGDDERRFARLVLHLKRTKGRPAAVAYLDARRLGGVRIVADVDAAFAGLGPDAWLTPLGPGALKVALGRGAATLKERLLDQKRVAGLGNIAVIEACFRARVHPHMPIEQVGPALFKRLVPAIHDHLEATLASTLADERVTYVSEGGDNIFQIYGRKGEPCPRCETLIVREVLAGRPTFFCPRCQRLPIRPQLGPQLGPGPEPARATRKRT